MPTRKLGLSRNQRALLGARRGTGKHGTAADALSANASEPGIRIGIPPQEVSLAALVAWR